jgi:hypothetical protein
LGIDAEGLVSQGSFEKDINASINSYRGNEAWAKIAADAEIHGVMGDLISTARNLWYGAIPTIILDG